jgi:hypothetical protein
LPYKASIQEVKDYLEVQVCILRYNNPDHTEFMVKSAILSRMVYWLGNAVLSRDAYYLGEMLNTIILDCFSNKDYVSKIEMDSTRYWYSDDIMRLSGEGRSGSVRSKAKQAARSAIVAEGYTDDLKSASAEYRASNFNVKPTLKLLHEETGYADLTIRKYGRDYYILRGENIEQRVARAREVYPEHTQRMIAELLKESKRTVRLNWKGSN